MAFPVALSPPRAEDEDDVKNALDLSFEVYEKDSVMGCFAENWDKLEHCDPILSKVERGLTRTRRGLEVCIHHAKYDV